ncbi:MAG: M14 family metallopeptidase [Saprospiraceae bacterium]|nr:M14 family metallopeptidase [Saprospiraceae bacterium]MBP6695257.1 M14 family metallopeptidase [Saprospiraceae bacterium]
MNFIKLPIFLIFFECTLSSQNPAMMSQPPLSHFEKNNNYTPTYFEVISNYKQLTELFPHIQMKEGKTTDSGFPLHEVVLSKYGFDPEIIKEKKLPVLLINNGIHPGEPCGIDASILFVRNLLSDKDYQKILDNMVIVVIPVYNIDGALQRNSTTRANQIGPDEYGFRGNAKNLDLNRDFIKADTKNAIGFYNIFHTWDPDIFVDTHTSNGADYQYTMTLIASQSDKLGAAGQKFQDEMLLPYLYVKMKEKNWEMIPYVYPLKKGIPDFGIQSFLDNPRFSSGYASLFQTWSFMPEAHMLKPYADRVYSTLAFLESISAFISPNAEYILKTRKQWKQEIASQNDFPLQYTLDNSKTDSLEFKGYEARYKPSEITGKDRLFYDKKAPYTKNIPYKKSFKPTMFVSKPKAYIIPQAYKEIVQKLEWNKVKISQLEKDSVFQVERYKIVSLKTSKEVYEGHYPHSDVSVEKITGSKQYYKGDYIIFTDQEKIRFIIETLEPLAPDSYFVWNFFDGILNRKEHFSAYVFEDLAIEILHKNPELKKKFLEKKKEDAHFALDANAQLNFIYENSVYAEPEYKIYPVARLIE